MLWNLNTIIKKTQPTLGTIESAYGKVCGGRNGSRDRSARQNLAKRYLQTSGLAGRKRYVQENNDEVLVAKTDVGPTAAPPKKKRRALWIVLAVLGACMLFGLGAIAGGGAVYGLTRAHSRVYVRPLERWVFPRAMPNRDLPGLPERGVIGLQAGAMIVDVVPDGPADQAGLNEGDLLIAIDGVKIDETSDLAAMIAGYKPGDEVTIEVAGSGLRLGRGGREVAVVLGQNPDDKSKAYLGVTFVLTSEGGFRSDRGPFWFQRFSGEGLSDD